MTLFLSFREKVRAGGIRRTPLVLDVRELADPLRYPVLQAFPESRCRGHELVFATHGFHVDQAQGVRALARLEGALDLPSSLTFVGVLWPGDSWIPYLNYPAEAPDAVTVGRALATYARTSLWSAADFSFISHSLGARVVLEAVKGLGRRAREVCTMAAAADDDCLTSRQYDAARRNCERVSVLASRRDRVLKLAYPLGDFFSDLFNDDDAPNRAALGYRGPHPATRDHVLHSQIAPRDDYGHFDYLPSDEPHARLGKEGRPIQWLRELLAGAVRPSWP